jgi:hypothetical protein
MIFPFDNPSQFAVEGHIYDVRGTRVGSLVPGSDENTLLWDGQSDGHGVPGGIYFYRIQIGDQEKTGSVVVVR